MSLPSLRDRWYRAVRDWRWWSCLVLLTFTLAACDIPLEDDDRIALRLPPGATYEPMGNGWYFVRLPDGPAKGCYIFRQSAQGYQGYSYLEDVACD